MVITAVGAGLAWGAAAIKLGQRVNSLRGKQMQL